MPAKVAVIIPARYASTRLPAKPLVPIAGKPLIEHVWERCQKVTGVDAVIVATDDMRIAEAVVEFDGRVMMTSAKHRSGTDRVAEVARALEDFTHVINVQGDEPLIDPKLVSQLASTMVADESIEMITAANVFAKGDDITNPNLVKVVMDRAGDALYFSRSAIPFVRGDGVKPKFYRHQGIYGYTTSFLEKFVKWKPGVLEQAESLEQLRALENGAKIRVVLTKHAAVGVDSPADVTAVEALLRKPSSKS